MNLFVDPISATVAGWQMMGKTIEQQLRIGTALNQALMAPFKAMVVPKGKQPTPDFTSKRLVAAPTPKIKPAPRKTVSKPKATKPVLAPKVAKLSPIPKAVPSPAKPAPAPKVAPKPEKVAKSSAKPAAKPKPEEKPLVAAPKPVEAAVPKPRRKTRAPSTPPAMPSAAKGKPQS